jgi:hypothetical protein
MAKKILLIEDNADTIKLWKVMYCDFPDIITTVVSTIEAARYVLKKISFDLVFLDGNLTVHGPKPEPETFPLFLEFKDTYRDKIIFISDYDPYVEIMKKHGVVHVEKSKVPEFSANYFRSIVPPKIASNKTYELRPRLLLVVQPLKNPFFSQHVAYVAEIVQVSPLNLKIAEDLPILRPHGYRILEAESCLIQGTLEEQNCLLKDYASHAPTPLESGLKLFGGVLTNILKMPTPVQKK